MARLVYIAQGTETKNLKKKQKPISSEEMVQAKVREGSNGLASVGLFICLCVPSAYSP